MKDVITISAPLSIQVHFGNPGIARIPELHVRTMPQCEGGGWCMPTAEAEALVAAWNGFINTVQDEERELPTWAQLAAYWKDRSQKSEAECDRLAAELKEISEADIVDLMLDPSWAKRIATHALSSLKQGE